MRHKAYRIIILKDFCKALKKELEWPPMIISALAPFAPQNSRGKNPQSKIVHHTQCRLLSKGSEKSIHLIISWHYSFNNLLALFL